MEDKLVNTGIWAV